MFEKTIHLPSSVGADEAGGNSIVSDVSIAPARGGNALRAVEWSDLTAKLEAARDLRRVLQRSTRLNIEGNAASFGDAAASYFRAIEESERAVNQTALEPCKASDAIGTDPREKAQTGVRETKDD